MLSGAPAGCVVVVTAGPNYNPLVARELSITRREDARGLVLALAGDLDLGSAPRLERSVNDALAEPHARLVLDLGSLTFVDSTGVTALIKAKQRAVDLGRILVLRHPTEQVHEVFALVGMADWLAPEG